MLRGSLEIHEKSNTKGSETKYLCRTKTSGLKTYADAENSIGCYIRLVNSAKVGDLKECDGWV